MAEVITNPIMTYTNENFENVRSLFINGEPWFVGKDITDNLKYKNSRDAIAYHVDEEDKGVARIDTPGGAQDLVIVNESGLYALIFGSKLPKAKEFKHWVTSEVLPTHLLLLMKRLLNMHLLFHSNLQKNGFIK